MSRSHAYMPIDDDNSGIEAGTRVSYYQVSVHDDDSLAQGPAAKVEAGPGGKSDRVKMIGLAAVGCFILFGLLFTLSNSSGTGLLFGRSDKADVPFSIFVDTETDLFQVVDNNPIFPSSDSKAYVLASGRYQRNVGGNGWNYLDIETVHMEDWIASHSASLKGKQADANVIDEYVRSMQALGSLEGFVTCHEMNAWYVNFYSGLFDGGDPTDEALEFLEQNHEWMKTQSDANYLTDDYWLSVKGLLSQLDGIVAGAKDGCPGTEQRDNEDAWSTPLHGEGIFLPSLHKRPALIHLLLMNANGDLYQIAEKFDQEKAPASSMLNDYPDDDDYFFAGKHNKTKPESSGTQAKAQTVKLVSHDLKKASSRRKGRSPASVANVKRVGADAGRRWSRSHYHATQKPRNAERDRSLAKQAKTFIAETLHAAKASASSAVQHTQTQQQQPFDRPERTPEEIARTAEIAAKKRHDHCSSIVKLLADNSDVLFAHNTWDDFQCAGPRIFKHYTYNNMKNRRPAGLFSVHFSSSPGLLSSIDDFYVIQGRGDMAVMETSIDVYNNQLLNIVQPETMLSWGRARLANQLAHNGRAWAQIFSLYHSGTYVNQWMVLDFRRFTPGSPPQSGFFTVLEEVPGYIHFEDMTDVLINKTYWASYNNPYFDDISRLTGQWQLCQDNPVNCFDQDPRGLIFAREHGKVDGVPALQRLIGLNRFQTDPLSKNDSCSAISCRQDLEPPGGWKYPFGAIDGKISTVKSASALIPGGITQKTGKPAVWARLGPTHDDQPPFCWSAFDDGHSVRGGHFFHVGHPECYDFDWEVLPPADIPASMMLASNSASSSGSVTNEKWVQLDRSPAR